MTPVHALLVIVGWHGATSYRVAIVGETPKRFRVCALEPLRLPRVGRKLRPGETALVPRSAVRVTGEGVATEAVRAACERLASRIAGAGEGGT